MFGIAFTIVGQNEADGWLDGGEQNVQKTIQKSKQLVKFHVLNYYK